MPEREMTEHDAIPSGADLALSRLAAREKTNNVRGSSHNEAYSDRSEFSGRSRPEQRCMGQVVDTWCWFGSNGGEWACE